MLPLELSTPQRQAPLGVIIIFFMTMRRWANVFIFGLLPFLGEREDKLPFWIFYVFAATVVVFVVIWSYLQWKNYFFSIEDDKFVIRQGVIRKEETLIALERIQSVQIKRNIVQQILNLAALQLDTAGSSKKEAQIPALKYAFAEELKRELIALKTERVEVLAEGESPAVSDDDERVIMQLTVIDIFKVGLTENHLQSALLLLGVFFGYTSQFSELLGYEESGIYEQAFRFVAIILPVFIVFFFIVSVFISMGRIFLRYFDLKVSLKKTGLSVSSGLLKKEENFVPVNKIQYIKWMSNPLRRLIGYKSLAIYQASSQEVQKKKTVRVPGCKADQKRAVEENFFPEFHADETYSQFTPHGLWKLRLMLIFVLAPLALATFFYFAGNYEFMGAFAAIAVLDVFLVHKYVQKFKASLSDHLLVLHKGFVFPQELLLKLFKVQNVAVKQSFLQKRRGLVSVRIYTASGSVGIPFVSEEQGFAIANKLLFEIESSAKKWM